MGEQGSSVGSSANSKTAGVPSQALVGTHASALRCDITASETGKQMDSKERTGTESERERMTSPGNCNKQEREMEKIAGKERTEHKRTINIAVLNESELLNMIKGYVNSMYDFAKNLHTYMHRISS